MTETKSDTIPEPKQPKGPDDIKANDVKSESVQPESVTSEKVTSDHSKADVTPVENVKPTDTQSDDGMSDDMMSKLKKPMTVTVPTWGFLAAGLAALVLLIAALD